MFVVICFGKPSFDMCRCTLYPLSLFILVGGLCPLVDSLKNLPRKSGTVQGGSGKDAFAALHSFREGTLSKAEASCCCYKVVLSSEVPGIGHGWKEESRLNRSDELIWYGRL